MIREKEGGFHLLHGGCDAPGAEEADPVFQPRSLAKVGARGPCAARLLRESFSGRGRSPATAP